MHGLDPASSGLIPSTTFESVGCGSFATPSFHLFEWAPISSVWSQRIDPDSSRRNGGVVLADVMEGVRILEVAEHTFVPAASAILADWGADVIKIEHPERGDAMRGLASSGVMPMLGNVHVLLEHSNRGKRSIGIDVQTEAGIEIITRPYGSGGA